MCALPDFERARYLLLWVGCFDWLVQVAMSDEYVIVSSHPTESAYIYERQNGTWTFKQILKPSDPGPSFGAQMDRFGRYVSIAGTFAIVGADANDDHGWNSGSAYIFERQSDGQWLQQQKLTASDASETGYFGGAVAINAAGYCVVAARGMSATYTFQRQTDGTWLQLQKLPGGGGPALKLPSVAISEDQQVIVMGDPDTNIAYIGEAKATPEPSQMPSAFPTADTAQPSLDPTAATPGPTTSPTNATAHPTAETPGPTTSPTAETPGPTVSPTLDLPDSSGLFFISILSNVHNANDSYSLILATISDDYIELSLDYARQHPLEMHFNSVGELEIERTCESSDCVQFWEIKYSKSCDDDELFTVSGHYNVQFSVRCRGDYIGKMNCRDRLEELEAYGITGNKVSLSVDEFEFNDAICDTSLYSHSFSHNIALSSQTDTSVYMEIDVADDADFIIEKVVIMNVFACASKARTTADIDVKTGRNGIGGCMLGSLIVPSSLELIVSMADAGNTRFGFELPSDIESGTVYFQMQVLLSVESTANQRRSHQIRHYITPIEIELDNDSGSAVGNIDFAGIVVGIVGAICFVVLCLVSFYNKRKKTAVMEANNAGMIDANKGKGKDNIILDDAGQMSEHEAGPGKNDRKDPEDDMYDNEGKRGSGVLTKTKGKTKETTGGTGHGTQTGNSLVETASGLDV